MHNLGRLLRTVAPLFAAAILLSAVACATTAPAPSLADDTLTSGATPGPAQVEGASYDALRVSGVGIATGTPDLTTLSLGVFVTAETVAEARDAAALSMTNVITALKNQGVLDADITTSHFRIREEYDYSRQTRKKVGYSVSNGLTVIVRQTDSTAAVIDAAVAAGGDHIEFSHIDFSFSDSSALEREAREAAVADMQEKASQLAEFAGRELGDLKMISDVPVDVDAGRYSRNDLLMAASMEAAYDTPIAVGDDDIAAIVYGVYELK